MRAVLGVALVGLVACVGCGRDPDAVSDEPIQPKVSQEEAIAAIEGCGGKVTVDKNKVVVKVHLIGTKVTDAGLVHLKGLTKLTTLNLSHFNSEVTDAGLVHLKRLTKLEDLSLNGTKVTDAGLVHLKEMTKLERLYLGGTKVTDAGLVHLIGLTKLYHLDLAETKATAAGVKKLKQALPNCKITR